MKRYLLFILLMVLSYIGSSQTPSTVYVVPTINDMKAYFGKADRILVMEDTADYVLCTTCTVNDFTVFQGVGTRKWLKLVNVTGGSGGGDLTNGGPITSLPTIGFTPGTQNVGLWIERVFYQSQPPTVSISGGVNLPLQSAATLNYTLNYTSGRQASTDILATIVVAGVNQTFSQPAQGASVSGAQNVSFPANTNISYSNVTTTADGKSATATTSFTFLPKRYYGWISDTTGIGTTGFDDSQITGLSSDLTASKSKSWTTTSPTGTQFLVYAYYSTSGALTQFDMNGFPSLSAMNSVTRSFTTTEGYTGTWIIYWSKNGQTLSSTIVAN